MSGCHWLNDWGWRCEEERLRSDCHLLDGCEGRCEEERVGTGGGLGVDVGFIVALWGRRGAGGNGLSMYWEEPLSCGCGAPGRSWRLLERARERWLRFSDEDIGGLW